MSAGGGGLSGPGLEPAAPGTRVTWLELFFDLVFVFAFFNVTAIFVAALSIPTAFSEQPQRHLGDFVFAGCYLVARGLQDRARSRTRR